MATFSTHICAHQDASSCIQTNNQCSGTGIPLWTLHRLYSRASLLKYFILPKLFNTEFNNWDVEFRYKHSKNSFQLWFLHCSTGTRIHDSRSRYVSEEKKTEHRPSSGRRTIGVWSSMAAPQASSRLELLQVC